MTNFEAITASLYPYSVDPLLIEKACIDGGLDTYADYSNDDKSIVARSTIAILRNLVSLSSESNGGYSLSYSVEQLKERIYALAKDNGFADIVEEFNPRPTIEFL